MDKTAWMDPPWSNSGQHEMREVERRRAEKMREADRARMDRIEAKLDMLLGNVPAPGVRVYDADGVDVTRSYEITLDFSGHKMKFTRPPTADEVIESLQVMRLLPDGPHWLYAQDPHAPAKFNKIMPTEYLSRSCRIQAQQVQEKIPA